MTYRVGRHWGVTIVREGVEPIEMGKRADDELLAVVVNPIPGLTRELTAERIALMLTEGPVADDAIEILRYALHLRMHGERAPGGNETWATFDRRCEAFLRRLEAQP